MTTRGCSNLTLAYLQHRLYSPVAPAWCGPALHPCADPPPTWLGRVDRVECSPESLALCGSSTVLAPTEADRPKPQAVQPSHCPASDPPPIYKLEIVQQMLTPVVQGSMLDILA